jgi:hypothetical protein
MKTSRKVEIAKTTPKQTPRASIKKVKLNTKNAQGLQAVPCYCCCCGVS